MRTRILTALVSLATVAMFTGLASGAALAQAQQKRPEAQQKSIPEAPKELPRVGGNRTRSLEFLFGALKVAPDDAAARYVEARIWSIWTRTSSDTAQLLMGRAKTAVDAKNYETALQLLNKVTLLRPDYVEGWNRRATIYFLQNNYTAALADIRQVLAREPRHFGALAGLGMILQEIGEERRALEAFRKALEINPRIERVPDIVKNLTVKVEGRDI
jgi:Flp pilus assembly protein TadD